VRLINGKHGFSFSEPGESHPPSTDADGFVILQHRPCPRGVPLSRKSIGWRRTLSRRGFGPAVKTIVPWLKKGAETIYEISSEEGRSGSRGAGAPARRGPHSRSTASTAAQKAALYEAAVEPDRAGTSSRPQAGPDQRKAGNPVSPGRFSRAMPRGDRR
jgi:hypothetical protein